MAFMVKNRLTQIIFPQITLSGGAKQISIHDPEWAQFCQLCSKNSISPPSEMQEKQCQHYVMTENQVVVAGLSILTANIMNSKMRIAISVEIIVSNKKGSGKAFVKMLSKHLKYTKGESYLVTQALDAYSANRFWSKHLVYDKEADALVFMMCMLDPRYKFTSDTTNKRITF